MEWVGRNGTNCSLKEGLIITIRVSESMICTHALCTHQTCPFSAFFSLLVFDVRLSVVFALVYSSRRLKLKLKSLPISHMALINSPSDKKLSEQETRFRKRSQTYFEHSTRRTTFSPHGRSVWSFFTST